MENKNDNSNKEEQIRSDNFSKINSSNELKSGPKKKLLDDSSSGEILGGYESKEKDFRKNILHKDEKIENIANNISAESKGGDGLTNRVAFLANKKKGNKDLTVLIILGVIFLLIIGGIFAYFLIDKKLDRDDPQQIIKSSLEAMNNVNSHSFEGDINIDISSDSDLVDGNDPVNISIVAQFDGQTDQTDPNNIKSSFNVKPEINISIDGGNEQLSVDLSMMSFGKITEQAVYYRLNDFDLGAVGLIYGKMIVPYKGNWYFIDMKELQEMNNVSLKENDFDFEKMIEKVMELYQKYEIIKFKKDLGNVEIDGKEAYHYQVKIDPETLIDFYIDFLEMIFSESLSGDNVNSEDFKEVIEESREEILAILQEVMLNVETEIWIGKEDKLVYKIYVSGDYDQEALIKIANVSLGKSKARALDSKTKSDMSMLKTELEMYYDDNASYTGFDPEFLYYYDSENMNIITDDNSYLIWSELATTTDKWCVDSSGLSKSVYGDIEGTQCNVVEGPRNEAKKYDDLVKKDISKIDSNTNIYFEMSLNLSGFNQPTKITRPENAENLVKTMEEMFGGFMGEMVPSSDLDSDNDGLSNNMEEIYGTDKNNPDTDGDGHKDGEEVKNGYDPTIPGDARLNYDKLFTP